MDKPKMLAAYGINKILLDKGFTEDEANELERGILKALVPMVTAKMERSTTNELNEYIEYILSRLFNTVIKLSFLNINEGEIPSIKTEVIYSNIE